MTEPAELVQLHLVLPYKTEPREIPRVAAWLERGYRIVQLQRLTDREVLVTLGPAAAAQPSPR